MVKKQEKNEEKIMKFITKCPECGREIKGTSASQVAYNLKVHQENKHGNGKKGKN